MENQVTNNNDEIEIDLGEVFHLVISKLGVIILSGILLGVLSIIGTMLFITPKYESTTKIMVLNKQDNNTLTSADMQTSTQLTKDYAELIQSRTVLEGVIAQLNLDMTYKEMLNKVSVETSSDSRIVSISVTDEDPYTASEIANAVRDMAAEHIQSVMDIEAVNVVDSANLPTSPVSPSVPKWTLIGAVIGIIIAVAVVVIQHLLDDSIKSSEDIEKYLGISTLALIPMNQAEEETASRRRSPRKGKEKVVLGTDDEKARSFKSSDINKNTNNKNSKRNADGIEFMED